MRHLIAVLVSTTALLTTPLALAGGDAANGKNIALQKGCAGCHGVDGNSPAATWPKIAGQGEKYMVKQLKAFRDNDINKSGRANAVMYGFAKDLSDQEISDISAYFAGQKLKFGEADASSVDYGLQLYRGGDKTRGIPSCMGCHGPTGAGNPASGYPRLAGQWAAYTESQLNQFKLEERRNDENRMMRDIASKMYPEDIKAVSNVIQGLHD
jgi:cytochrome c553